jgi:hypothetical protein
MMRGTGIALGLAISLAFSAPAQEGPLAREAGALLAKTCLKCHNAEKHKGGLRLDSRTAALQGGDLSAKVLVPGKSAESDLVRRVRSEDPEVRMPPEGPRLAVAEIETLRRWIDAGAEWAGMAVPAVERKVSAEDRAWWAFQPVRKPALPAVRQAAWVRTPVDAFILARLESEGLAPSPEASRRDLARRVSFDLTGLPPAPADLAAFERDGDWEGLIDRLLASPAYGERWGQHWLDVVRFAESEGYEYDTPVGSLWRYRDYVVESLNADKPFDRFFREQVAGDEIEPADREARIAAGFHRLGPVRRNKGNQDVASSRNEVLTDRTDILGGAFLGMTLGCARCHDHKFDPILQKDYYRFQGFLAATDAEDESLADAATEAAWKAKTEEIQAQIAPLRRQLKTVSDEEKPALEARIDKLEDALPPPLSGINTIRNLPEPTAIHVLKGGEHTRKADPVGMRFPSVLVPDGAPELPLATPKPRTRLADWLVDPKHPLTARVLANRVWQHHFGAGLVRTPNDFGKNGERPSHPELLDWLASTLVEGGWRLKDFHRLLLRSSVYRQTSASQAGRARDPENRLLGRFSRRRLSAEEIRDAMLAISGKLNPKRGGESVFVPVDEELVKALYKPSQWAVSRDPEEQFRRSIYLVAKRNLRLPSMEVFDQPDLGSSCGRRESSTHAPQALELLNGRTSNGLAAAFAERLRREAPDDAARVELGFRLAAGRPPSSEERRLSLEFLRAQPLREFALALFNLNAVLYVD